MINELFSLVTFTEIKSVHELAAIGCHLAAYL